jgi:CBS domain-containing protein
VRRFLEFGDLVVETGCATESQVRLARLVRSRLRREKRREVLLAELLLEAGVITTQQLVRLLERGRGYREHSGARPLFGDVAVAKGYASPLHVYLALQTQLEEGAEASRRRLGEIMVERGDLTPRELEDVLRYLDSLKASESRVFPSKAPTRRMKAPAARLVGQFMRPPVAVASDATVGEAIDLAQDEDVDSVLVMRGRELVGTMALWDLLDLDPEVRVARVMSTAHARVSHQTSADEAARILSEEDQPCLAVIVRGVVAGFVTRAELREAGVAAEKLTSTIPYEELGGSD